MFIPFRLDSFWFFFLSLSFLKSNRSDSGGNISRRRLRVSLEGNPFCPGAPSFNRMSQQKVRSTMSKLATMASRAGFDVAQSGRHILWRFCRLPLSSLWELIKHWAAWGRASAPREGEGRGKKSSSVITLTDLTVPGKQCCGSTGTSRRLCCPLIQIKGFKMYYSEVEPLS